MNRFHENYYEALLYFRDRTWQCFRTLQAKQELYAEVNACFVGKSLMYLHKIYRDSGYEETRKYAELKRIGGSLPLQNALREYRATGKRRLLRSCSCIRDSGYWTVCTGGGRTGEGEGIGTDKNRSAYCAIEKPWTEEKQTGTKVNLEYWNFNENLGDLLAPVVTQWMLHRLGLDLSREAAKPCHLMTIGSVLGLGVFDAVIWGSGSIPSLMWDG